MVELSIHSKRLPLRRIGESEPVFIIAEIGTDHNGDLSKAYALIDAVEKTGADCAKFQMVFADEILHQQAGSIETQGRSIPIHSTFKALEKGLEFYSDIKAYTENAGLFFLCSVFGEKSAAMLESLRPDVIKIASPELNHYPLLDRIAAIECPVILSTGLSTVCEIETALQHLRQETALLHCVTSYPAPEEEYNLSSIPFLKTVFSVPVGISDHSMDPVLIPTLSVSVGATLVEKHICLFRGTEGLDDGYALTPDRFSLMVDAIRTAETQERQTILHSLRKKYGEEKIGCILGTTGKRLSPSERLHYRTTKRSIRATVRLTPGTTLTEANCAVLRSTQAYGPGLSPEFYKIVLGKRVVRSVEPGEGIGWHHLLW